MTKIPMAFLSKASRPEGGDERTDRPRKCWGVKDLWGVLGYVTLVRLLRK
jgi:hypothetical protein